MRNGTIKLKTIDENSFEFDESEMYPCDICGEFWPMGEMYELEDGRLACPGRTLLALAHRLLPWVEAIFCLPSGRREGGLEDKV